MTDISRRKFLATGTKGAAALGTLAILPAAVAGAVVSPPKSHSTHAKVPDVAVESHALTPQAFVVYIPDPRSGRLHYMVGEKEIVRHNPKLIAAILKDRG